MPFPPSGHLDNPGMEPESPASPASAGGYFTAESLGKPFGFSTAELPGKPFVWPVPETDYLRQARAGQAFPRRAEKGKEAAKESGVTEGRQSLRAQFIG